MIASVVAVAWASSYFGAVGLAIARLRRRLAEEPSSCASAVLADTVLIRPCAGDEPGLADRLAASGGAGRVVFAVDSLVDCATPAALQAVDVLRHRGVDARLVETHALGPNHKADQLARTLRQLPGPPPRIIVVADSDVILGDRDVEELVGELVARGDAATWAPPIELGTTGLSAAVLNGSMHAFPLLAGIDPRGFVGKLFAVRAGPLGEIGGFEALVDCLGEDMELARRLRAKGFRTSPARTIARAQPRAASSRELFERFTRWALVIRGQRPALLASYPLLLAAGPLAMLLCAVGALSLEPFMLGAGLSALGLRSLLPVLTPSIVGSERAGFAAPLVGIVADAMLVLTTLRAVFTRSIVWRGRRLSVGWDGVLASEEPNEPGQHGFREAPDAAGLASQERLEAAGAPDGEGPVDARELGFDPLPLTREPFVHVSNRGLGRASRDPELGLFGFGEYVANANRDDTSSASDAPDGRGPGAQVECIEGGALPSLRIDPDQAPFPIEQARRVADGEDAVPRIVEVHPEGADFAEEGEPSEIVGIHHRVGVAAQNEGGEPERDERVPPRRVVRDDEHGPLCAGFAEGIEAKGEHAAEALVDAGAGVPREEGVEPPRLSSRNQGEPS